MLVRSFLQLSRALVILGGLLAGTLHGARAGTLEEETIVHLSRIRAIAAGGTEAQNAAYNKQMDGAWQFFAANKPAVLPILRSQLQAELGRQEPSDLILLDIGLFLNTNATTSEDTSVARNALFRLNSRSAIIQTNFQELFEFAHSVAQVHDPRVLGLIESAFLSSDQKIFIPQHALTLNGTMACVFLYGAYGADSELALRAKLKDRSTTRRTLEVLAWLGSPDSVRAVGETLVASPDYETFLRVTSFMMRAGGVAGREFMLALSPDTLDARSREYWSKTRGSVQHVSFDTAKDSFAKLPGEKKLTDAEVKSRLDAMIAHFGQDDRTNPVAILDSNLDSGFLITRLLEVRSHTLFRLSDEALDDVLVTNALINALRYRGH